MTDLTHIIAPLAAVCKAKRLTYSWETKPEGSKWRADVRAGWPVVNGKPTGAHPWWTALADTEEAALRDVVGSAVLHWDR